jgi:hypothetical protein
MHAVSPKKKRRIHGDTVIQEPLPAAVKASTGECAPYNDHSAWIEDGFNDRVYVFGGTSPGDKDYIPTSNFFKCDAKTMHWEDLTVSFSRVNNLLRFDLLYYRINYGFATPPIHYVVPNFIGRRNACHNYPNPA